MNEIHPYICVILPTYKDTERLRRCIKSLKNQKYPSESFEVVIIDNDTDTSGRLEIDLPENFKIYFEPKKGSYSARNKGLSLSVGEIIAFTDSDCIPQDDWLCTAASMFKNQPAITRLSGAIDIFREPESSWLVSKFESITAFNQKYNATKGVAVTANLFVKRSVFDKVGKFDDSLMSGGDIEWNQRATEAGVTLSFCQDVRVSHPARKSIKDLVRKFRRVVGGGFNRAKNSRNVFRFILWHFIPPVRYGNVLIQDGKKMHEVMFACSIFWLLKVSMVFEIFRLILGGKPLR